MHNQNILTHNQRREVEGFVVFTFTISFIVEMQKKLFYYLAVIPVKEFIFSKVAGLQTATLLKNELLYQYFSRTLITVEGQLFCRNMSVWLLPLQTEPKKTSSCGQLTSKTVNFNFKTIYLKHYVRVWSKNFRSYFHIKTITNHFRSLFSFTKTNLQLLTADLFKCV